MSYKIVKSGNFRERRNFSSIRNTYELKDLLEIQKKSYKWFIDEGIKEVFQDLFPVENFSGTLSLEFGDYHFDEPKYSIKESKDRETTYSAPLRVEVRLFNRETGEVKEQEIFMGDMPMMTDSGTFVINGAERVIVSQLVRSPSVYFSREVDKNGRELITNQIIPNRGTWLEFEVDARDVLYVRIDRTRKVPITTLLRAFGLSSDEEILKNIEDFTTRTINEKAKLKLNREQRRKLEKKLGKKKVAELCNTQDNAIDTIAETTKKLEYIELRQKLRALNKKNNKENKENEATN